MMMLRREQPSTDTMQDRHAQHDREPLQTEQAHRATRKKTLMGETSPLLQLSGYVSVSQAAEQLGVSTRSVYGYIEGGKLPGIRVGASIVVPTEALAGFRRGVAGRGRKHAPVWRVPAASNQEYQTVITVQVRQGQQEQLEQKLVKMRTERAHLFPGTVARYLVQSQVYPAWLQIVLVWRALVMPPLEEREAALAELRADLDNMVEWEDATVEQWQVVLYA